MRFFRLALGLIGVVLSALSTNLLAATVHQHAHVHGVVKLDVAIENNALSIQIDSPLDSLVGFERAPRTPAEKQAVQQLIAKLHDAQQLFKADPQAACTLLKVNLESPALGLAAGGAPKDDKSQSPADEHADLDGSFDFTCAHPTKLSFIDVGLFEAFKGIRQVDVQIVTPQGQFKRTLTRDHARLTLTH